MTAYGHTPYRASCRVGSTCVAGSSQPDSSSAKCLRASPAPVRAFAGWTGWDCCVISELLCRAQVIFSSAAGVAALPEASLRQHRAIPWWRTARRTSRCHEAHPRCSGCPPRVGAAKRSAYGDPYGSSNAVRNDKADERRAQPDQLVLAISEPHGDG